VVTGENVTAEVDGMSFNLIPDAHFHGETMVTVTVQDKANPADKVSKEFLLMVESDGVELGCTDAAATNYDATANEDDGSCEFASQVTPETEAETKSSSSGSLGHFIVLLLPLLALRRRK